MKEQKGITLVALVITIIVLLILAGVSLSIISGEDGILTNASNAKDQTEISTAKEALVLKVQTLMTEYYEGVYVTKNADISAFSDVNAYIEDYFSTSQNISGYSIIINSSKQFTISGGDLKASVTCTLGDNGSLTNWSN